MYDVRPVTDDAELPVLHQLAVDAFDPSVQCHPDVGYPSVEQLRAAHRIYVAELDGVPVVFACCSERGQGSWMHGRVEHIAAAGAELIEAVAAEFGQCWAACSNEHLTSIIAEGSGGRIVAGDGEIRWIS